MKQNMEHLAEDRSASSLSKLTASSSGDTVVRRPGVSRIDFAPMVEVTKKPGFLPKVFSRPNLRAKDKNSMKSRVRFENRNNAQDIDKRLGHLSITPVPYVRPLGFKMEPRVEPGPRNERMIYMDDLHLTDAHKDISRSREEAECAPADHLPTHSSQRTLRACKSQPVLNSQATLLSLHGSQDSEANISLTIARQREAVASMAASDAFNVANWKAYLQSYSEGRFNLNVPPHPPPRAASFTYLPAIFPDDEEKRQLVSNVYDAVWPGWEQSKTGTLLRDAMKRFVAPFAAVSFFDGAEEYFKAEKGYNKRHIPRAISVAAHVLLSSDVLIILDTFQDWRFAGNPLVVDGPKIRFFAGVPMLASGGEIIGVIAIFDTQPRKAFTPSERRALAEFSQLAMQDLDLRLELLSDEDVRSTPILQRSSLINANTPPRAQKSPSPKTPSRESYESMLEEDMDMFPSALRFHKDYPKPRVSMLFMSNEGQDATEPTPPSSSGSEAVAPLFYQEPRGFGKNLNQLSINSGQDLSSFHDLITPDSAGFARSSPRPLSTSDPVGFIPPSPRPFSSSDLTSLDPHPPNTPNASLVEGTMPAPLRFEDITVESFMSLTDLDIAEGDVDQEPSTNQPSSPLIDLYTPQKHDSISTDLSSRSNNSSKSSGTQKLTGDSEFMTEAAFSCQFTAQNLGYDLVYAAQVKPAREFMTEEELTQPGGLKVKILVAYGLDKPLDLCAATHLRILRSQGFETIEHVSGYQYQEDEYETGHMMRLVDDGLPREERRSGIVFGAFRKPKDQQLFRMETPPRVEMQKLLGAAEALRFILTKSMERAKNQRSLAAELAAVEAYPANEALEVGRSLRNGKSSSKSRMSKRD